MDARAAEAGAKVVLGVRPEHLVPGEGANAIAAPVTFVDRLGGSSYAYLDFPGAEPSLTVTLPGRAALQPGERLALQLPAAMCHLFDAQGLAFPRVVERGA
ncbi:MAG: hypothetical protein Fur0014_15240 [Rubrivivax sp.]